MNGVKWGAFAIDVDVYLDDEIIDPSFFDAIVEDDGIDWENIRERVSVRARHYILIDWNGERVIFDTFADFIRYMSVKKYAYIFCYDAVHDFAFIDWEIHRAIAAGVPWKRYEKPAKDDDDEGDDGERAAHKRVQGYTFGEMSGELGQRYSLTLWVPAKATRAEGGDRHERTHKVTLYGFRNIFTLGFSELCKTYGADEADPARALYECISRFSELCAAELGAPYLTEKKPLALTAGGLAKNALLSEMYGGANAAVNTKRFRKCHPLTVKQSEYLRERKLMRGGIVYGNPAYMGRVLYCDDVPVKKYDVTSEYPAVAYDMPDLQSVTVCADVGEIFAPRAGYTYIIIFRTFNARVRRGMPAVFQNPFTGKNTREVHIYHEFALFLDELEEMKNFYTVGECDVAAVLRVKNGKNDGYRRYIDRFFTVKQKARADGDRALETFAKLMLNSALGKLAQKVEYPTCTHEYNPHTMLIELRVKPAEVERKTAEKDEKKDGAAKKHKEPSAYLSIIQGAYVTAMGRVMIMRYIRRVCGDRNANETFIYTDTDSIHTFANAPSEIVRPASLGYLKEEGAFCEVKYVDKKLYYTIKTRTPLNGDFHCRGVPLKSIADKLCYNYGVNTPEELPPEAFDRAFDRGVCVATPLLLNVTGGRLRLYGMRAIIADENGVEKRRGATFVVEGGILTELN